MNRNQVTRDNEQSTKRKGAMACAIAIIALLCGLFSKCEAQATDTSFFVLDSLYSSPGKIVIADDLKSSMISIHPFDVTVYHSINGEWEIEHHRDENGILFKAYLRVWRKDELVFSDSIFFATKK